MWQSQHNSACFYYMTDMQQQIPVDLCQTICSLAANRQMMCFFTILRFYFSIIFSKILTKPAEKNIKRFKITQINSITVISRVKLYHHCVIKRNCWVHVLIGLVTQMQRWDNKVARKACIVEIAINTHTIKMDTDWQNKES